MIVEKEIAQVTSMLESTKPSNVSATEEKGSTALNSSNTTYADSLVFSDLSEDSISSPKNSPSPPGKASSPLSPPLDPDPPPPPPCPVSDSSLSQVPSNNSLLGMAPFPHQFNYTLSQPVIPSQHGFLFPPAARAPQIQQPPPSNWSPNQLPLPTPYTYVPQGSWGWAQPLNAPVFHQPQVVGSVFRPSFSSFGLSSVRPVPTHLVPTLRNPAALASKPGSKKVSITAPTKPTSTTTPSHSQSVVQTTAASSTSSTATSTNQAGNAVQTTAASTSTTATNTNPASSIVQTTAAPKNSANWETAFSGAQSGYMPGSVQQSSTNNDTKLSVEAKTSQPTSSPPSISQPATIGPQSLTSISHQPAVSQPSTSQPLVSQPFTPTPAVSQPSTSVSRPPPLYSRVTVPTIPKSSIGLGRGKSMATLSPPSPHSVGVGRGHSTTEGWHTIQSRRNPITTPESFPPIGSGAGLDII